uniref:Uncharacterized protein n=1 Tax=Peronospora matthiolae TaxID=2874970 RepID=A0AAV1UI49_9STRA
MKLLLPAKHNGVDADIVLLSVRPWEKGDDEGMLTLRQHQDFEAEIQIAPPEPLQKSQENANRDAF